MNIADNKIKAAEQILIDNGIEADEVRTVLQALGFALLDEDLYPPKYVAKDIKWDKTDVDGSPITIDLPSEVEVDFDDLDLPDNATDDEVRDALATWLVDWYGVNHNGFVFEKHKMN